jgi:hypothetical protein
MAATNKEIAIAAPLLESYAEGINWMARLAPAGEWAKGAELVINAADAAQDQSPGGRQIAAQIAIAKAISDAGYGSMMTDQECHDAAAITLASVNKLRRQ